MSGSIIRGTPIYVARGDERIALVPEVRALRRNFRRGASSLTLTAIGPAAVYIIDRRGVRRLALGTPLKHRHKIVPLWFLAGPLIYLLALWSKRNG
ncbi:MAG TPA: hypothetical protein VF952_12635 [Chloroflexia bacterium]